MTNHTMRQSRVFMNQLGPNFFLLLSDMPLYRCILVCLSIYLLRGIWVDSKCYLASYVFSRGVAYSRSLMKRRDS